MRLDVEKVRDNIKEFLEQFDVDNVSFAIGGQTIFRVIIDGETYHIDWPQSAISGLEGENDFEARIEKATNHIKKFLPIDELEEAYESAEEEVEEMVDEVEETYEETKEDIEDVADEVEDVVDEVEDVFEGDDKESEDSEDSTNTEEESFDVAEDEEDENMTEKEDYTEYTVREIRSMIGDMTEEEFKKFTKGDERKSVHRLVERKEGDNN